MRERIEDQVAALRDRGYVVIDGVLTNAQVAEGRAILERMFQREARGAVADGRQNDLFKASYMLVQKHPFFRSLCENRNLLELVRDVLGSDCIMSNTNGFSMVPGCRNQSLHIDQHETTPGTILSINALHTLDNFTRENGCTRVVPGSQNRVWTGEAAAVEDAEVNAVYVEAPPGSIIAYDGALWHAGSRNATARDRFAVHLFFVRKWVMPQWDFPASLSSDVAASLSEEQRQLFGFSNGPSRYDSRLDREVRPDFRKEDWRSLGRILRLRRT